MKAYWPPKANQAKCIIGMLHLRALPGAPLGGSRLEDVLAQAVADAQALEAGGVDAILVQNRGDRAFAKTEAPPDVVAAMSIATHAVVQAVGVPVGVHVLRNDTIASLAIAAAAGAQFVRAAVLTGVAHTAQGLIEGDPHAVLRYRQQIGAGHIPLFADVASMHNPVPADAAPELAGEAVFFGDAAAIVVALPATDAMITVIDAMRARVDRPILVGGYASRDNIAQLLEHADGAIVGGAFEPRARHAGVSVELVRDFMARVPQKN